MATRKDNRFTGGDDNTREEKGALDPQQLAKQGGLGCTTLHEPLPKYLAADCEAVLPSSDGHWGSYIVFGRDRPSHATPAGDGYGNKGHTGAAMLDLVVGRNVAGPLKDIIPAADDETKVVPGIPPNFERDAARVYISQKSDIDEYFELTKGTVGAPPGKSCVALKADGIRILAREGIKIISGLDEYNSRSAKNSAMKGINLIYGNKTDGADYELQPMVRGRNLRLGLNSMADMIGTLSGMIADICMALIKLAIDYATHMHIGNFGAPAPALPPTAINAGMTLIMDAVEVVANKAVNFQTKHAIWKTNYTNPLAGKYINSKWNHVN